MTDQQALGALLKDILEGASFVRLDNINGFHTLILDLTWSLTDAEADMVRETLRAAATESERNAETD